MLCLTPGEAHFFIYTKDKIVFEERKHDYEVMRRQTRVLASPYLKKNSNPTEEEFMPFSWDKGRVVSVIPELLTPEAWAAADARYCGKKAKPFIPESK